jgi:Growth inhibitor
MGWNDVKAMVQDRKEVWCNPSEIWWAYYGENIGSEQNGAGKLFLRPVVILKRHNKKLCFVTPLTSQLNERQSFLQINWQKKNGLADSGVAILNQTKTISTKRLSRIMGKMSEENFKILILQLQDRFFN